MKLAMAALLTAAAWGGVSGAAAAQDAVPAVCADCATVPALTPVRIELLVELGSRISKSGDSFPIRLAEDVVIDGRILLPAGSAGMGEVVHAKKSGGSGVGGELVLAARWLEVDGRRLRLRSMTQGPGGKAQMTEAMIAGAVAGPLGLFVTGRNAVLPVGTIAGAKTAEAFVVAPTTAPSNTAS